MSQPFRLALGPQRLLTHCVTVGRVPTTMGAIVVVTTVGTEEQANTIASKVVERRQAACVNILPGARSIYRWRNEVCQDSELILVIKTLEREFEAVAATIAELHTYDVPEILAFDVHRGERTFLDWIAESVAGETGDTDDG